MTKQIMDLIDAYAEARHVQGHSSYNIKTQAARQAVERAIRAQAAINSVAACGVQALSAAPAIKPLEWSSKNEPTDKIRYNHITAETALGQFSVEWKGWKEEDGPCVYLAGDYIGVASDVDGAKQLAERHIYDIVTSLLAASPTPPAEQQAITSESGAVYAELPEKYWLVAGEVKAWDASYMRDFADRTHALRMKQAAPKAAPGRSKNRYCGCGMCLDTDEKHDAGCPKAAPGEPAAYLIDWPDEPELGHYFSESPTETGRCRPLYLAAPPTAPAVAAPDPVAYLYDDGSWTPAKTEEGRKLSNWMISAGSPKIGVLLASAAQPTRAVQATQTGNQREARPCHVFTVRKAGGLTEWEPTSMAFALPDGAHALYTLPQPTPAALLKEARGALWQPANVALCERIDAYLDAARKQGADHDKT